MSSGLSIWVALAGATRFRRLAHAPTFLLQLPLYFALPPIPTYPAEVLGSWWSSLGSQGVVK